MNCSARRLPAILPLCVQGPEAHNNYSNVGSEAVGRHSPRFKHFLPTRSETDPLCLLWHSPPEGNRRISHTLHEGGPCKARRKVIGIKAAYCGRSQCCPALRAVAGVDGGMPAPPQPPLMPPGSRRLRRVCTEKVTAKKAARKAAPAKNTRRCEPGRAAAACILF